VKTVAPNPSIKRTVPRPEDSGAERMKEPGSRSLKLWLQFLPRQANHWLPATNTPRGSASALSSGGEPRPTVLETSPYPLAGLFKTTVCPTAGSTPVVGDGLVSGSVEGQSSVNDSKRTPL